MVTTQGLLSSRHSGALMMCKRSCSGINPIGISQVRLGRSFESGLVLLNLALAGSGGVLCFSLLVANDDPHFVPNDIIVSCAPKTSYILVTSTCWNICRTGHIWRFQIILQYDGMVVRVEISVYGSG